MTPLRSGSESVRSQLLSLLQSPASGTLPAGSAERVRSLIENLEQNQPADLARDQDLLRGVWELRWSSSRQPYLAVASWLENLQLLDPARGRGMNLLRLAGPLGPVASIAVQAEIAIEPAPTNSSEFQGPLQRVSVRFKSGGWLGPRLGPNRLQLLRQVSQSVPAWLDITVLDDQLRVCRGSAGTLFALVRRLDLSLESFF